MRREQSTSVFSLYDSRGVESTLVVRKCTRGAKGRLRWHSVKEGSSSVKNTADFNLPAHCRHANVCLYIVTRGALCGREHWATRESFLHFQRKQNLHHPGLCCVA